MSGVFMAAMGDVLVDRAEPRLALEGVRPIMAAADLVFGNFEGVLSDSPAVPGASRSSVVPPHNGAGLAGFDVVSLANNHSMDAGAGGLSDTVDVLARHGVQVVGAGSDLAGALAPVTITSGGIRIAFLAVTAVLQHGAEARRATPGVAPLRAEDAYLPMYPGVRCPGVAPRIVSILDEGDWERLEAAIGQAKESADVVVVSAHWGDHTRPWALTDHERLCAELIIEAGADVVLGHHQHMMRGVDFIGGKPILYGLGHIAFDYPRYGEELTSYGIDVSDLGASELTELFGEYGIYPRPEQPAFPFHSLARRTGVAVLEVGEMGVRRCGIIPCVIDGSGTARPVMRGTGEWQEAHEFLLECQSRARLTADVLDNGSQFSGHGMFDLPTGAASVFGSTAPAMRPP